MRTEDRSVAARREKTGVSERQEMTAIQHSGPLPHPDVLRGYAEINPSFPERIMKMAEENNKASIEHEELLIRESSCNQKLGIWTNFVISILGLAVAVVLGIAGIRGGAAVAVVCSLCPGIIAMVGSRRNNNQSK